MMEQSSRVAGQAARRGWVKWAAVSVVVGFLAFLGGPNAPLGGFWGAETGAGPQPTGTQLSLLILLSAIQALVMGFGIAYLIFGSSLTAVGGLTPGLARLTHLSVAWSLINWWPHTSFHQVIGDNIGGLLAVDYGFHVTLIAAALVVAYAFAAAARRQRTA